MWSVRLLWASTLLSIPSFCLEVMRAPSLAAMVGGLVVQVPATAFACYLYVCIRKGRNWARVVTLLFTLLSVGLLLLMPSMPGTTTYEKVFGWANAASDVVCMVLLFTPSGSAWFRRRDGETETH